ncbi:tyrosine-type recombinase/integrase [Paracraurococcus lichenis]|uniref:Tyrosine-type recombinase/integrase n=1 Tax=Paracraurococcus lichenis TaxID=3064888 RepID=A0ABT9EBU4_9PROT|nr:tyrosine-type recombinase/integrase [Paracraurococcus sp. LOR1-02]MDO9713687.1 tyrosine-type recombinase/integrase [Paracraurococcus sp. LOR1-02]
MSELALLPDAEVARAATYARQALSPATLAAYAADWAGFEAWCAGRGVAALPATPVTVAAYLAAIAATHAGSTLRRRLAAIGRAHRMAGLPWAGSHPAIGDTLAGIARRHGTPQRRAAAIGTVEIRKRVATCTDGLTGTRDRALLLLGFAAALRRSELVAVEREHLTMTPEGLRLLIPRGKTDQQGRGAELGIPRGKTTETCPVRALEAWLQASDCRYGPVFRKIDRWGNLETAALHPYALPKILARRLALAGIKAAGLERLSLHGLRAGFITEAYGAGVRDEAIMEHSRHRDIRTMRGYVRRAKLVGESPAGLVGL